MTQHIHRRPYRLAGLFALVRLVLRTGPAPDARPLLPTSPRLRRDIGLPELDPERPRYSPLGQKL